MQRAPRCLCTGHLCHLTWTLRSALHRGQADVVLHPLRMMQQESVVLVSPFPFFPPMDMDSSVGTDCGIGEGGMGGGRLRGKN